MEFTPFIVRLVVIGMAMLVFEHGLGALALHAGVRYILRMEMTQDERRKHIALVVGIMLTFMGIALYLMPLYTFCMMEWEAGLWIAQLSGCVFYMAAYDRAWKAHKAKLLAQKGEAERALPRVQTVQETLQEKECALVEQSYVTEQLAQRLHAYVQQAQEPVALRCEREWVVMTCGMAEEKMFVYGDCFALSRKAEPYFSELKTEKARTLLMQRVAAHLAEDPALCVMEMKEDAAGCVVFGA
jgi:uncharacterized membrane protein